MLVLIAGIALLFQAGGQLHRFLQSAPSGTRVVTGDLHAFFAASAVVSVLLIVGVIAGVLGLLWMIAQIPRKNAAGTYRLQGHDAGGFTVCDPAVLAGAVENQVNILPGVVAASAMLRGSANAPDLTLKVTVNDRANIQDLIHRIDSTILLDLANALEAPLQRARLQVDVSGRTQRTGTVVQSTGTVVG
ncbi:hypothetical protein CVV68_16850 [Arthrobacter livingstonensis]|uniref:Alkaline shock response membrane anchor protein AmaP n=1 Tax=Arthrobacter livingstonensis TaxID=670078 RepID=A0A2V5L7X8_9MICC|nr:hypothetical protein CVV68_16850 [Arthrobacter livingstonensis]